MAEDSSPTAQQPRPDTDSAEEPASEEAPAADASSSEASSSEQDAPEDPSPAGESSEAQQHPDEAPQEHDSEGAPEGAAVAAETSPGEGAPDPPAASGDGAVIDAGEEGVAMTEEESTPPDAVSEDAAEDAEEDTEGGDAGEATAEEATAEESEGEDEEPSGPVKRMLEEAVEDASSEGDDIPSSDDVSLPSPGGETLEEGAVSSDELRQGKTTEDVGFTGEAIGRTVSLDDLEQETAAEQRAADESYDRLRALIDETTTELREQEIVPGRVLQATESDVLIDIGYKSDGVVDRAEFGDRELSPGDEIEVWLEFKEDRDGQLVISKERADRERRWQRVEEIHENEEVIEGEITERIKGGMIAEILDGEMEAFLPGSQIDVRRVRDFEQYLGRRMEFKIVKLNPGNENIVISHRVLIEKELEEQREKILSSLEVGQVLQGVVKNIVDFGAFVDLGGVDGLLHITDLSWGRVSHPSEVVELDQELEVVVLDYEEERQRISLGLKQLTEHPWDNISESYAEGDQVEGKVVSITNYGAFVELEAGIEGLVHISEMSWTRHVNHPSQMVSLGQLVDVQILNIDEEERKISLGMKQLEPDPWEGISDRYPAGTVMTGTIRNITHFGCFVEIEPGIDGLVHISDLSWTKKVRHPKEIASKGDEMDVKILDIDEDRKRISLGHKQVQTNPWEQFAKAYAEGEQTTGEVVRVEKKGIVVELPLEVEAFVPGSELKQGPRHFQDHYQDGDELELQVIRFDREQKDIVLSETALEKAEERAERREEQQEERRKQRERREQVQSYQEEEERATGPTTLGEMSGLGDLKDQMDEADRAREAEEETDEGDLIDEADVESSATAAPKGGEAQAETERTTPEEGEGQEVVTGAEASGELEGTPGVKNRGESGKRQTEGGDAGSNTEPGAETAQRQEDAGDVTPAEKSEAAHKGVPEATTDAAEAAEEIADDETPATDAADEQATESGSESAEEIESFTDAGGGDAVTTEDVKATDEADEEGKATAEAEMGGASAHVEADSDEEADRVARTTDGAAQADAIPEDFPHASRLESAGVTTFTELEAYDDLSEIDGIGDSYAEDIRAALDER
jgi:small subunit ribosomal protein S1